MGFLKLEMQKNLAHEKKIRNPNLKRSVANYLLPQMHRLIGSYRSLDDSFYNVPAT
jgi:hypothetical protein